MSDCREGGKMQLTDYIGIAGLYTRLSRDDGTDSESNVCTIGTHKSKNKCFERRNKK